MTRVVVLTSTSPRHRYFATIAARHFDVVAILTQPKRSYYVEQSMRSEAVRAHFTRNTEAEIAEFGDPSPSIATTLVTDINASGSREWARAADAVLLFGTGILDDRWLDAFPRRIINLHLGLSPFYRGSATLFWPLVERELACVGATIHLASEHVDAGDILRRVRAHPRVGDNYYSLTNRTIREAIDAMPITVKDYLQGSIIPQPQGAPLRKAYRKADFNEDALAQALAFFGDGLTQATIDEAARSGQCAFSQ